MNARSTVWVGWLVCSVAVGAGFGQDTRQVPLVYSTDLHHPHMDPDDHFDLATLFSLDELDIRGIVLDGGDHQLKAPGSIPVRQLLHVTGRQIPYATGLRRPLQSVDDDGRDPAQDLQQGVELLLDVLRRSAEKVIVVTTGSVRDVAAAFQREPELLRQKISRLYLNIGNPATGQGQIKNEYNVNLDRQAYLAVLRSGLPIYWCPCFDGDLRQRGRHGTFWRFTQRQVLETAPVWLQNWFIFALTKPAGVDPIAALTLPQDTVAQGRLWPQPRNMWCTGPLLHAAGRNIYRRGDNDFVALRPKQAAEQGLAGQAVDVFSFAPVQLTASIDDGGLVRVWMDLSPKATSSHVYQVNSADYEQILTTCLRNLFRSLEK